MEQVVSLLTAFARYFERCILHTRIRHEYNYYLEWRQVSKSPNSVTIIGGEC
jgi:hypothetical protein